MERFAENPLITPDDVQPTRDDFEVIGTFNPGAFVAGGRIGLLVRVAERPIADDEAVVRVPVAADGEGERRIELLAFERSDPAWDFSDARAIVPREDGPGACRYLTGLSHLRLAWSDDGRRFEWTDTAIWPTGDLERFGIEDARVTQINGRYRITYSAISDRGICVGLISTVDFLRFARHGCILPHENKDVCLFPERVGGDYVALHRPSSDFCRPGMWIARSPDLEHWGGHRFLAAPRPGEWDSERIGAGPAPVRTPDGWLVVYHGAGDGGYGLGLMLLDSDDPAAVLARSDRPIMTPEADYEQSGFFANVVFCNGMVARPDGELWLYYGGADRCTAGCRCSLDELLGELG